MPVSVPVPTTSLMNGERLYSPAAAAKASNIPGHRGGSHLNGSTVFRHITKGVRASNGELIRLEAVRVGSRWLTSLEALARFAARLTQASIGDATAPANQPTPSQRNRAAARAHDELSALLGSRRPTPTQRKRERNEVAL